MRTDLLAIITGSLLLLAPQVHALQSDRDKPMDVVADRVDVDDKKGISTFRGKVVVTRGTLRISGDIVVIKRDSNQDIDNIVATGNRAMYKQRPDNKPADVVAHAKRIHYDAKKEIITLDSQAQIKQAGDTFKGGHLVYHAKTDVVSASNAVTNNNKQQGDGRVRMTLQPSNKKR